MPAIFQPQNAKKQGTPSLRNSSLSVSVALNVYGGTLIKVLILHQHRMSLRLHHIIIIMCTFEPMNS